MEKWESRVRAGVFVEAVRLNEDNAEDVAAWAKAEIVQETDREHPEEKQPGLNVFVSATGECKRASLNMYVVKVAAGAFFVMHNRPFELSYKPVGREAPPLESIGDAMKERGFADPFGGRRPL